MKCCEFCFGDSFLKKHIEIQSNEVGNCNFCPSQDTKLISPNSLYDLFSPLMELYEKDESSNLSIVQLLKSDWEIFSDISEQKAKRILEHIIEDHDFDFDNYKAIQSPQSSDLSNWEDFKKELKHNNRFFPKSFPKEKDLSTLLSFLSVQTDRNLERLFRARLNNGEQSPFKINEMGAPPAELASGGRANPLGISYLYLASSINTAISEIRPHKHDLFTIANYEVKGGLKLIDLRNPRRTISPFRYTEEELSIIHSGIGLLVALGKELTKPVSLNRAQLEYLPSQYLCEFIKSQSYEGVIYKSSLGDGDNYAIFDSSKLEGSSTKLFKVTNVEVSYEDCKIETNAIKVVSTRKPRSGKVKWFNDEKGFGFISDKSGIDYFVHYSSIKNDTERKTLITGECVSFIPDKNKKGHYALDVSVEKNKL